MLIVQHQRRILRNVSSGNNNPDNYQSASSTFAGYDYDTEVATDIYRVPEDISGSVVDMSYQAAGGYGGSGCWRATPIQTTEGNGGWKCLGYNGANIAVDETSLLVISGLVRMSSAFTSAMASGTSGYGASGHKIFDVFMWNSAGSGRDNTTRQVIKLIRDGSNRLVYSHLKGGAGNEYTDDGVNAVFDFNQYPDEWIWWAHAFDRTNEVTRSYVKRQSDQSVRKVLERWSVASGHPNTPAPDEPYVYTNRGWHDGEGQSGAYYFWDDLTLAQSASRYIDLDRQRVGNGWFNPPF